jgi:hypothetical protein
MKKLLIVFLLLISVSCYAEGTTTISYDISTSGYGSFSADYIQDIYDTLRGLIIVDNIIPNNASFSLELLSDVPTLTGQAGKALFVNLTENGVEWNQAVTYVISTYTSMIREVQSISVATTTIEPTTFTIGASNSIFIYINGIMQSNTHYTIAGNVITFTDTITPTSSVEIVKADAGPRTRSNVYNKVATYTIDIDDDYIIASAGANIFTLTLPDAVSGIGKELTIKKIDASANAVIVDGNSTQLIDGELTHELTTQYDSINVISDGENWWIH